MNKKISIGAAILLMAMTAAVTISITVVFAMHQFNLNINDFMKKMTLFSKLATVDQLVRTNYVGNLDESKITDDIIKGYIAGTGDKHANYFDANTYKQVELSYEGKGIGIGVSVVKNDDGNIKVESVADGSPAATAKVQPDDIITKIGSDKVTDIGYDKAVELLKGDAGTKADFTVLRGKKTISFSIVRKQFETQTVQSRMIDNIGYVKIIEFDSNTDTQFSTAVDNMISQGAQGLVFDVRNNPGGELVAAENMLDKLLPKGPIVSATYKDKKTKVLKYSDANEVKLPMAVITNENTASAAELFTAALRDYGKAKSVGTKTYGKGTMQQMFSLNDGSAFSISIAYFNPPKSPNFDGKGIEPDIKVELSQDKLNRFYELKDIDDDQLQSALSYVETQIQ